MNDALKLGLVAGGGWLLYSALKGEQGPHHVEDAAGCGAGYTAAVSAKEWPEFGKPSGFFCLQLLAKDCPTGKMPQVNAEAIRLRRFICETIPDVPLPTPTPATTPPTPVAPTPARAREAASQSDKEKVRAREGTYAAAANADQHGFFYALALGRPAPAPESYGLPAVGSPGRESEYTLDQWWGLAFEGRALAGWVHAGAGYTSSFNPYVRTGASPWGLA